MWSVYIPFCSFFVFKFENKNGFRFFPNLKTKKNSFFVRKVENEKGNDGIYTDRMCIY